MCLWVKYSDLTTKWTQHIQIVSDKMAINTFYNKNIEKLFLQLW
jgi:hypothetical protein